MTVIEQLFSELNALKTGQFKVGAASGTPAGPYLHGPQGLFGVAGLSRDVISSRITPMGLAGALPVFKSVETNPLYAYITGFQSSTGEQPDPDTNPCGDAPIAGAIKNVIQTARFGSRQFRTREINIRKIGRQTNRGEFFDLRVLNDPLAAELSGTGIFSGLPRETQLLGGRELLARFLEVGVSYQNDLGEQIWIGSGTGAEFPGLDLLIGINKYDSLSGARAASLDSDIKNFNYAVVTSATNPSIVHVMTTMRRYVGHNATRGRFGVVKWSWVMRQDLFNEITDVWPVEYATYRIAAYASDANVSINLDGFDATRIRDEMRNGKYLVIDGEQIPVIIDDFIVEESNDTPGVALGPGQFASDIYLIPMTVRGGLPVTFWETFDYSNGALQADLSLGNVTEFWTDNGFYLWNKQVPINGCHTWQVSLEPRIRLLTPQLAGRITNVAYAPLQHTRDANPNGYYHVNGGVTTDRPAPSLYSDWNTP